VDGPVTVARERPVDALILLGMVAITLQWPLVGLQAIVLIAGALGAAVVLSSIRRAIGKTT
jgi:hypothetical protein